MGIMFVFLVCGAMASRPDDFSHAVYVLAFSNAEALGRIADYRSDFVGRSRVRSAISALSALQQKPRTAVVINIIVSLGICARNSITSPSWVTWGGASALLKAVRQS
jgi:hypothetical protein